MTFEYIIQEVQLNMNYYLMSLTFDKPCYSCAPIVSKGVTKTQSICLGCGCTEKHTYGCQLWCDATNQFVCTKCYQKIPNIKYWWDLIGTKQILYDKDLGNLIKHFSNLTMASMLDTYPKPRKISYRKKWEKKSVISSSVETDIHGNLSFTKLEPSQEGVNVTIQLVKHC